MKTRLALSLIVALGAVSCVSSEDSGGAGTGGSTATGGTTGGAGTMGGAGTSGSAGTTGGAGTSGSAGTTGAAGSVATGRGGTSGTAGSGAAGGVTGAGGTTGTAGRGGTSGVAGTTGGAGTGGAGTTGVAGSGGRGGGAGTTGFAGSGGRGGTTGVAGSGGRGGVAGTGVAGSGGRGGTTGSAGATGSGGTAAWQTGYTATMFGNHTTGDCNGVSNFSDTTNISGANCTYQGVTIASFMSGVANDASFYGAPGDESSIWTGPLCKCQSGQTENATGMCPSAPSCAMEANCGKCFEVKCDPNGTGTYSNGDTRTGAQYCNASKSAVIEVIDACPHNHPSNTWWCTNQRKNHIDISCSAMEGIIGTGQAAGSLGWVNVQVRPVDCSVGLGIKSI